MIVFLLLTLLAIFVGKLSYSISFLKTYAFIGFDKIWFIPASKAFFIYSFSQCPVQAIMMGCGIPKLK